MYCPRIDHFVRFNWNGTLGKCGHMVGAPEFRSWQEMQASSWLADIKTQLDSEKWPAECVRCRDTEAVKNNSIRIDAVKRHEILSRLQSDYLILSGIGDNICNSACQSCNANLSTKIGSLYGKEYIKVSNYSLIDQIPMDRVTEIDINGGEPTASSSYQRLVDNLPPSVKVLRINTNGSRVLKNLDKLLEKKIQVIVTLSLDGTGPVHDYVRWPIRWENYQETVSDYINLADSYSNLKIEAWTTLHTLNAADFGNILSYCDENKINHSWAYLQTPTALNVKYTNSWSNRARDMLSLHTDSRCRSAAEMMATLENNQDKFDAYVRAQDSLRKISIGDYYI